MLALYQKLSNSLSKIPLQPQEVLFIGNDMLNDIYGAQQMGFKTVLFAGDQRSLRWRKDHQLTQGLKPDFIINDLMQILDCLGRQNGDKK